MTTPSFSLLWFAAALGLCAACSSSDSSSGNTGGSSAAGAGQGGSPAGGSAGSDASGQGGTAGSQAGQSGQGGAPQGGASGQAGAGPDALLCSQACARVKDCGQVDLAACEAQCSKEISGQGYLIPEIALDYFRGLRDVPQYECYWKRGDYWKKWSPGTPPVDKFSKLEKPEDLETCLKPLIQCQGEVPLETNKSQCFLYYYRWNPEQRSKFETCFSIKSCLDRNYCFEVQQPALPEEEPWLAGVPMPPTLAPAEATAPGTTGMNARAQNLARLAETAMPGPGQLRKGGSVVRQIARRARLGALVAACLVTSKASAEQVPELWGRRLLVLSLSGSAWGSPVGMAGVSAEVAPIPQLVLEAGLGIGYESRRPWRYAASLRHRHWLDNATTFSVGGGVSLAYFTRRQVTFFGNEDGVDQVRELNGRWLDLFVSFDQRKGKFQYGVRLGMELLTNQREERCFNESIEEETRGQRVRDVPCSSVSEGFFSFMFPVFPFVQFSAGRTFDL